MHPAMMNQELVSQGSCLAHNGMQDPALRPEGMKD